MTFLRPRDAAKIFGVSYFTIIRWLKRGQLRGQRRGHSWFIPPDAIQEATHQPAPELPNFRKQQANHLAAVERLRARGIKF